MTSFGTPLPFSDRNRNIHQHSVQLTSVLSAIFIFTYTVCINSPISQGPVSETLDHQGSSSLMINLLPEIFQKGFHSWHSKLVKVNTITLLNKNSSPFAAFLFKNYYYHHFSFDQLLVSLHSCLSQHKELSHINNNNNNYICIYCNQHLYCFLEYTMPCSFCVRKFSV